MEHFVLLQRSNIASGMRTVGKSVGFFYTHLRNVKPLACWCASAVMPARIRLLVLNNTRKPFLLNVLKITSNEHTASNDGGKDRNRKSPCLHSIGAQIHRTKHYQQHLIGTHCLLRRELQYQGATRHARDGCETEVLGMLMNLSSVTMTMVQDYIGD